MKKIIGALIGLLVCISFVFKPVVVKAAVPNGLPDGLFGLGDPNAQISYYDVNGVWKYYCFTGQCYDITTDKLTFTKDIQPEITDLQNKVNDLQTQLTNLASSTQPIINSPIVAGNPQVMPTLLPAYTVDELKVKQNLPSGGLGVGCYPNFTTITCSIGGPLSKNFSITVDGQPANLNAPTYFGVGETHNYTITYHEDGREDTVISKDFVTTDK
jgi:hypothetical protein